MISKITVLSFFGMCHLLFYFIGTVIGGAISGLSLDTEGFGIGGILCCMVSKMFFMVFMTSMACLASVYGKSRIWLSVLLSLGMGMLLFTMISMTTPLNATFMNVVLCIAGGILFGVGLGALAALILNKLRIV